jgi:hypothetical protein
MFKEEMHEDGCEFCSKLEKLLEEIEWNKKVKTRY